MVGEAEGGARLPGEGAETDGCELLLSSLRSRALCCSRSECFVEELELLEEEEEEEEEEPRDGLAGALTEAEALAAGAAATAGAAAGVGTAATAATLAGPAGAAEVGASALVWRASPRVWVEVELDVVRDVRRALT